MADPHSTPDFPAEKTERSLIVGYRPQGANKNTPSLILSGKWLREAGFDTGQQVCVKVVDGCIVLMAYNDREQALLDELKETRKKLAGIETALVSVH